MKRALSIAVALCAACSEHEPPAPTAFAAAPASLSPALGEVQIDFDDASSLARWIGTVKNDVGATPDGPEWCFEPLSPMCYLGPTWSRCRVPPGVSSERLFWGNGMAFRDGSVFCTLSVEGGDTARGGGVAWRVRDARNYYLAELDDLRRELAVYVVRDGVRTLVKSAPAGLLVGSFAVHATGDEISVWARDERVLACADSTLREAGGVGLWVCGDARTKFYDVRIRSFDF